MLRKRRVRMHLEGPSDPPSVEGLLLRTRPREFVIGLPALVIDTQLDPAQLSHARELVIPRERVIFFEVLK